MQIIGLDHILLAMPPGREDEASHFYGVLLGLTELNKPDALADLGGCWFEGPGLVIHIGVDAQFIPATKAHPAFLALDLEALQRVLSAAGFPVKSDENLPDVRRFFSADPFGNRVEFIQAD